MRVSRLLCLGLLGAAACSSPPTMGAGWVPPEVRDVSDPMTEVGLRLEEAGPLVDAWAAGGDAAGPARTRVETLVREVAGLMGHQAFDPWPLTRARLRTRVLFVYSGEDAERRTALQECRGMWQRLREDGGGTPTGAPRPR